MVYIQYARWSVGVHPSEFLNMRKLQIFSPEHFIITLFYIRQGSRSTGAALLHMLTLIDPKELNQLLLVRRNWPVDCLYQACDQLFENLMVYLDVEDLTTGWGIDKMESMPGFLIGYLNDSSTMLELLRTFHIDVKDNEPFEFHKYDEKTKQFRHRVDRVLTCLRTKCSAENFYEKIDDLTEFLELLVGFDLHQFLSLFLREDFQIILKSKREQIYRASGRQCDVCLKLLSIK